jgi:hypothetical protein
MEVPRAAVVLGAGAALAVVVVAGCELEVVVADAALSGNLNKLLNGALEAAVAAADELGV